MQKKLIDYYPYVLQQVIDLRRLSESLDADIATANNAFSEAVNTRFVSLADEAGIAKLEELYGVKPKDTDKLEDRRFRLWTTLTNFPPFTLKRLKEQLAMLCQEDGYTLIMDYENYKLTIRVGLAHKAARDDVEKLLAWVVPANLVVDCSILWNQYYKLEKYTYRELESYTYQQIREDENI